MSKKFSGYVEPTRYSHGALLVILCSLVVLMALACSAALSSNGHMDAVVAVGFALNAFIGTVFFVEELLATSVSLRMVHWLFYLTFMVIAPFSQVLYGYDPWGYQLDPSMTTLCNGLLFVWALLFRMAAGSSRGSDIEGRYERLLGSLPRISKGYLVVLLVVSLASSFAVYRFIGSIGPMAVGDYSTGLDKTTSMLFETIIRPLPLFSLAVSIVYSRQKGRLSGWVVPFAVLSLCSDFPTSVPRYAMACQYGGIALLAFKPLLNRRGAFALAFLVAFLIVFPAANVFKWGGFEADVIAGSLLQVVTNLPAEFCAVDYDAYSMLARTIDYVGEFGTTGGNALLTVLLFFVPRAWWPGKEQASGEVVASAQGQVFTDLSCPLPAEGIINFGFVGLLLFAFAVGLVCRKLDSCGMGGSKYVAFAYCFMVPIFFYVLRGALLPSWAYAFGYSVVLVCLMLGAKVFERRMGYREDRVDGRARKGKGGLSTLPALAVDAESADSGCSESGWDAAGISRDDGLGRTGAVDADRIDELLSSEETDQAMMLEDGQGSRIEETLSGGEASDNDVFEGETEACRG